MLLVACYCLTGDIFSRQPHELLYQRSLAGTLALGKLTQNQERGEMHTDSDFPFDVFLSHNSKDKKRVRGIAERLKANGLRVFLDEWSIQPGDDIYLNIERAIEGSRTLVLCLSPAALESDWVSLERSTALFRDPSNRSRRFIPVLLADCELPATIRRYKYIDLRNDDDAAFATLLHVCRPP